MSTATFTSILNVTALAAGQIALSYAFDWKVGLGVAAIAYFLKHPETV